MENNVFEELNKLYEEADKNLPTLLDIVRCSVPVIVNDVRDFTHADAERIAARYNFDNEVDFDEEYDSTLGESIEDPLAGRSPEKFIVPKEEVKEVLRKIANNHIFVNTIARSQSGRKNLEFMDEHTLSEDDIRELAKQLQAGDYSYSAPSNQAQYAGHILTFFITKKDFRLADGRTFDDLHVYVKVDTTEEGIVTAISFHRGSGRISHPYTDED